MGDASFFSSERELQKSKNFMVRTYLGALLQSSYCNLKINLTTYYSCLQSQKALTILGISFSLKVYSKQIYEGEMLLKTHTYCDLMFYLDP